MSESEFAYASHSPVLKTALAWSTCPASGEVRLRSSRLARSLGRISRVVSLLVASAFLIVTGAEGQATGTITGVVTDANSQQEVAGVQVFIQGLDIGGLTNAGGRYLIQNAPTGQVTVQAERLGYSQVTQTVNVGAGETVVVNLTMSSQVLGLDEIVVTGTAGGTQRRAVGNVVERMSAEALVEAAAVTDMDGLISNRVAGVTLTNSVGQVGAGGGVIRIRGVSSMGTTNNPIIYIDGVRMNSSSRQMGFMSSSRLNDINPNDIESIEVIKGPAAATLYGTEASAGVIQIITKRGQVGAPLFDASIQLGANWLMNPSEKVGDYFFRDTSGGVLIVNMWDHELEATGNPIYTTGLLQDYNFGVRGGTDFVRYSGSLQRGDQVGYTAWNDEVKTGGRLALDITPSETVSFGVNGNFFQSNTRSGGSNIWRIIQSAQITTLDDPRRRGFGVATPEELRDGQEDRLIVDRYTWSGQVAYQPFTWLSNRLVVGTDVTRDERETTTFREADAPSGTFASAGLGRRELDSAVTRITTADLSTTARYQVNEQLGTATSAGLQYYTRNITTEYLRGDEFATAALRTVGAAGRTSASETFLENTTLGVYLQEEFDWEERIFLTAAIRADDNSAFGSDFDIATYPKVSAAWVVHEESFWNIDAVSQFRLRGAWGAAGQQPDVFAATTLYETRPGPAGEPELTPQTLGNSELGPERGEEIELGFDAEFLDGRIAMGFTRYWRTTSDAITPITPTTSLGYPSSFFTNIGEVSNWGNELSLDIRALSGDGWGWDLGIIAATMKNRIEDLGENPLILVNGSSSQYHVEGYPLAGFWDRKVVSGQFASGDSGPIVRSSLMCDGGTIPGESVSTAGPAGGAPVPCDEAPLVYLGRAGDATWSGAVTSTLTYGNWQFRAHVDARGGHRRMSQQDAARNTTWGSTRAAAFQDDAVFMGQRAISRPITGSYSAGFARLREVSLTYRFPAALVDRLGLSNASVNVAARTLGLLWQEQKYMDVSRARVVDPEVSSAANEFEGHNHTHPPPMATGVFTLRFAF